MLKYIFKKIIKMIPLLLILSAILFGIMDFIPGDFVDKKAATSNMSEEKVEKLKEIYGLDKPVTVRYGRWLKNAIHGDFDDSLKFQKPVTEVLGDYVWNSFILAFTSFVLTLLIAIPVGVISAVKQYSIFDKAATVLTFIGNSFPSFFLAIILMKIFAVDLNILPISNMKSVGSTETGIANVLDIIKHMVLPVLTLTIINIGSYVRYVRTSMLEVINQDYIRTARAKGLKEKVVIYKHGLRNALIPIVTFIGMQIPTLFAGAIITETVFAWPGIGKVAYDAIGNIDYTLLMGFNLFIGLLTILGNVISDILYSIVDPRIKLK